MRLSNLLPGLAVLMLVSATAADGVGRDVTVTGVVRAPLEGGRIVVAHDEIVGFMPAMTMGFDVAGSAMIEAAQLAVGSRVRFELHVGAEQALADHFEAIGRAAPSSGTEPEGPAVRRLHPGDSMPSFSLVAESGRVCTLAALSGHVTLLTFIFTRCPVPEYCPAMARRFGQLQKAILADPGLSGQARLLGITLDPEYDRPEVLAAYGRAVGANPAVWSFATGAKPAVDGLIKAFSVYTERNGATLGHTLCTALVNRDGRIVAIWRGNGWSNAEVLDAMRAASQ
jgi:protein SCO1